MEKKNQLKILENFNFITIIRDFGLLIALIILVVFLSIRVDGFLHLSNIFNIFRQISMLGIIAGGMTILLISGGFDLSVGSNVALSTVVMVIVLNQWSLWPSIIVTLLLGVLIGLFNGFLVNYIKINAFVTTLSTALVIRGFAFFIAKGVPIMPNKDSLKIISGTMIGPVPLPAILLILVLLIFWFVLHWTKFGRYTYAIGGNSEASLFSGINVKAISMQCYLLCGLSASLAGIIFASRINIGQGNIAESMPLDVLAAVLIGGTSLSGGVGSIFKTVLGVFFLGFLTNGFNLLNVSPFVQMIIKGFIIIIAVGLENFSKRK